MHPSIILRTKHVCSEGLKWYNSPLISETFAYVFGEIILVDEEISNNSGCQDNIQLREYTPAQELFHNIPYVAMTALGAIVLGVAFSGSIRGIIAGIAFLSYGIMGTIWIMIFVCPYCKYWNTKSCPCGYGRIAAKFRKKKPVESFREKFKKHIPVIVPLWFIPILVGVSFVIRSFTWTLLVLLILFAFDAFIILPLVSRKYGCKGCPQKKSCPWMKNESKGMA